MKNKTMFVGSSPIWAKDQVMCQLCHVVFDTQITRTHLLKAHNMTTKEYKKLGYPTLSESRLEQLRKTPVALGTVSGVRGHFGKDHWNWKGGHVAKSGYKIVSRKGKSNLYEHRLIAEEMIGRPLEKDEVVHHKDGNRSNNSQENLVVMKRREHDKLKDGVRAHFFITDEVIEAAKALFAVGWSKNKILRALRIHHNTLTSWLNKTD